MSKKIGDVILDVNHITGCAEARDLMRQNQF